MIFHFMLLYILKIYISYQILSSLYFTQDWFVVRSKSKSSKLDKLHKTQPKEDSVKPPDLPSPNPHQVSSTWKERQTPAMPMSSGTSTPGRAEIKRKEGRNRRKEKDCREQKDCYEFSGSDSPSSSSGSSSSSSESEAEDKWALRRPLSKTVSSQCPGSHS